ncbi:MAG: amidohydrolase family protein [Deltaproteobacteria bacterium]|jgi:imidazolonepropionase-like amidohydrolase|nr:amidohydrolase family protein [Deltaproteobacteria bacterium]
MINQVILAGHVVGLAESIQAKDKAICIENEKIIEIHDAKSYKPPTGVTIRDWSNYTVIPGLVDCHDHLGLDLGDEHAQALEHDFRNVLRGVRNARHVLSAGITTLRSVGEKKHIEAHLRDAILAGWIPGPRMVICGQFIMRTGGHCWYLGVEADGPDALRRAVREQVKNGADFIKLMVTGGSSTAGSIPTKSDYTDIEIQTAIEEAHRLDRKVAAHIGGGPGARAAIEAGIDSIEHGVYLSEDDLALMAEKNTVLCVTYGPYAAASKLENVPEFMKDNCAQAAEKYLDTLAKAHQLNVRVVFGGDTYHADPKTEFKALIKAGFSPIEALRAGTLNGAALLGFEDCLGTIEPGKTADMVALGGNPLDLPDALEDVISVMKDGDVYTPESLRINHKPSVL